MAEPTPNPAPWKTWLLKAAIAVGVLVLVLGVPALVLHSHAKGEWRQLEAAHTAKGDSLDWQSVIPPKVPKAKNFAYTPAMAHLNKRTIDPDGRIRFKGPHTNGYPEWIIKRRVWVKMGWRSGYQYGYRPPIASLWHRLDNGFHRTPRGGNSTNQPPVGAQAQAEDILAKLKPFEPVINELMQARKDRPHIRFNVRYERHVEVLLPHLSAMKNTVVTHRNRGIVRLALDDTAGALEDLEMCLFLSRGPSIEPILISHLVAMATHGITMQLVFEGLSTRRWNEAQLAVIENELSQFNWLAAYHFAIRSERNMYLAFFQEMARNRLRGQKKFKNYWWGDMPIAALWAPGALRKNQNKLVRLYDERAFALVNLKTRTVDVRRAKHFKLHPFESKRLNEVLASEIFLGQKGVP